MKKREFTTNICLECIKKTGYSCCEENPLLPLTVEDVKQIEKLGYHIKDFVIAQKYTKKDLSGTENWWKKGLVKINGKMYKPNIKKNKNGKCYFLKPGKGCSLGNKRPFICRTYPFWVSPKGKIVYAEDEQDDCYIGQMGYKPLEGLKLIKEDPKKIKYCFNQIKKDCLSKKNQIEAENILREILKKFNES